jgi:cell division protein FtsI/penicillin-binding protein 2
MSASTIANDGVLMRPTVVREVVDNEGNPIPVIMDRAGNLLPTSYDQQGNLIAQVYDQDGEAMDLIVIDADGNPVEYPNQDFYNEDGEAFDPRMVSPWVPDVKWDLTQEYMVEKYSNPAGIGSCKPTGETVTIEPWVFDKLQEGMREAVRIGTLSREFSGFTIPAAGKTGTAEYCDEVALAKNRCTYGNWPAHAWTVAYAPFDDPEIAVVAFLYNGEEGASVAAPVVHRVLEAYFEFKTIDAALGNQ